jgi:hypothetical protein
MMHSAVVVEHRIDWRFSLHQDKACPGGIEKRHLPSWHGRQMGATDNLRIKARAFWNVAHRNAEMGNGFDRDHSTPPAKLRPNFF